VNQARLAELQRQRLLVREHLAWLDREIAATSADAPVPAGTVAQNLPLAGTPAPENLDSYQPDPAGAAREARRGCLLFTAVLCVIGALSCAAFYYFYYRDQSPAGMSEKSSPPAKISTPPPNSAKPRP